MCGIILNLGQQFKRFCFHFFALVVILFGEAEQFNRQCGRGSKLGQQFWREMSL